MTKPTITGFRRVVNATRYSALGIRAAWKYESAFRHELVIGALLVPFAVLLGQSPLDYVLLFGSMALVIIVELLNSAVEAVVDRIGAEHHELSGRAKDYGSAAVMFTLLLMALCWGSVAWTRFA